MKPHRQYIITLITVMCFYAVYAQDSIPARQDPNWYKAALQIIALKHGALVVRLKTNDRSVDAYRKAGKNELADKIVAQRDELNQKLVDAFSNYFTFCKVYFIYAKNTDALLKHQPYIFLNDKMKTDSSISLTESFFLIAEYGSYTQNERTDEYHYNGVYHTEPSTSTASTSSLVITDTTLTQLQEPFPFAVPVYLGGFIKAVEELDTDLDRKYNSKRVFDISLKKDDITDYKFRKEVDKQRQTDTIQK